MREQNHYSVIIQLKFLFRILDKSSKKKFPIKKNYVNKIRVIENAVYHNLWFININRERMDMEKVTTIVQIALKHVCHSYHNISLLPTQQKQVGKKAYNSVNIQKVSQYEFFTRISVFFLGFSYSIHPFSVHYPISNFASLFIMLKNERKCFFSFLCAAYAQNWWCIRDWVQIMCWSICNSRRYYRNVAYIFFFRPKNELRE